MNAIYSNVDILPYTLNSKHLIPHAVLEPQPNLCSKYRNKNQSLRGEKTDEVHVRQ